MWTFFVAIWAIEGGGAGVAEEVGGWGVAKRLLGLHEHPGRLAFAWTHIFTVSGVCHFLFLFVFCFF
ncbi:hypothetical protein DsansV1_C12g0115031 [Dioscorea sansibarensis]